MKERLEVFVKNNRGQAIAVVLILAFGLIFIMPKAFFFLDQSGKKMFWAILLISFGIIMFLVSPKKKEEAVPKAQAKVTPSSLSNQQLLDKIGLCLWELRKQQIWAYGCLVMGWLVLWVGKWSGHPHYSHYIFAIPVFAITFLAATRSWEKVHDLDVDVAKYTLEGIAQEKNQSNLKPDRFRAFASSYAGIGMWKFAFVRVSPALMIIFSLLNAGVLPLLVHHFGLSRIMVNGIFGFVITSLFIFFSKIACRPYYWMLTNSKQL